MRHQANKHYIINDPGNHYVLNTKCERNFKRKKTLWRSTSTIWTLPTFL